MKPRFERSRGLLGIAMIAVGIACAVAQQSRGEANKAFGQSVAQTTEMPRIENAKVETRAAGTLAGDVKRWADGAAQAQWLGYSVPAVDSDHAVCCASNGRWNSDGSCESCWLEDERHNGNISSSKSTAKLEGPRKLVVLYRAEGRKIGKIRVASEDCILDAGGLRMLWLTGVKPAESVALLAGFVLDADFGWRDGGNLKHGALMAIALHGDIAADRAMESFTALAAAEELRKQAAFWLGAAPGSAGEQRLAKMAKSDSSSEVRAQVTFALFVSKEPAALEEMIRMAHEDESSHVRGQALFWLAQKAGEKAARTITGAMDNDPDTEVKKKAVFARSQMPPEEGVPKLIQVAQTNRNPEVRKQAMFWLGQSRDPRALEFF